MTATIGTARLILRAWRQDDRAPFAAMNADAEVMAHLGGPIGRGESDAAVDRQVALADAGLPFFRAVERRDDGAFLGFIGVKPLTFDAPFGPGHEIGWRLARAHWGRGYAVEGAAAALAHGFATLPVPAIFAITLPGNAPSRTVMTRIGMAHVADGDFDHPAFPPGHPLSRHVLYRADRAG